MQKIIDFSIKKNESLDKHNKIISIKLEEQLEKKMIEERRTSRFQRSFSKHSKRIMISHVKLASKLAK